jgi:hypothetical protein
LLADHLYSKPPANPLCRQQIASKSPASLQQIHVMWFDLNGLKHLVCYLDND